MKPAAGELDDAQARHAFWALKKVEAKEVIDANRLKHGTLAWRTATLAEFSWRSKCRRILAARS